MTTATSPTTHRVRLSAAMVGNVAHPSVWLDAEAQDELGALTWVPGRSYSVLVGTTDALSFVADNVADYLNDDPQGLALRGSRRDSFVAIERRIRAALAGVPYSAAFTA